MLNLVSSLEGLINKLQLPENKSIWSNYYDEASQRKDYLEVKQQIILQWIEKTKPLTTAIDFGANTGEFSKLTASKNIQTIATDFDPYCINTLYREIKKSGEKNILPLIIDLSKPSPAIGVNNTERDAFINRTKVDLILALALVHHLVIGKNIPFEKIVTLFEKMCTYLIIEFIPKEDDKIQLMLQQKSDIYQGYNEKNFEKAFARTFNFQEIVTLGNSGRKLYFMKIKNG